MSDYSHPRRRWHWLDEQIKSWGWTAGIEVGVLYGQTLAYLLRRNPRLHMCGIDVWQPTNEYPGDRTEHREAALLLLDMYPDRLLLFEGESGHVHRHLPDEQFDFCFIDADHSREAVRKDIENYLPKIRPGGMLCGHDYGRDSVRAAIADTIGTATPAYASGAPLDGCWYYTLNNGVSLV